MIEQEVKSPPKPENISKNYQVSREIKKIFWECPGDALFCREEISVITGYSVSWLAKNNTVIPFLKGSRKKCLYRKEDVVAWIKGFESTHAKPVGAS